MNVLLMTLNSKFIHSNLAIQYIEAYWNHHHKDDYPNVTIHVKEFTINNDMDSILRDLYRGSFDAIFVSAYIWNIESLNLLFSDYAKLKPETLIIYGGPEVSYNPLEQLEKNPAISAVICGEGEETFSKAVICLSEDFSIDRFHELEHITTRNSKVNSALARVQNLDSIPFPYLDISKFENRIVYYESSRGCPYACAYCLSSASKGVRYFSLDRVYDDLKRFLSWQVPQVKFVDRTFNIKKDHALSIMKFLSQNDNGITNFHFEINADLLDNDYFEVIESSRRGLFQFEIGIQSTNDPTTHAINRPIQYETLKSNTLRLIETGKAHVHVDLIAALPYETYERFLKSFDDVFALGAEQVQLGFLKLLKGTPLYEKQDEYGYKVRESAPFEVLENRFISYESLSKLKELEMLLEWYHNSGKFKKSLLWLIEKSKESPSGAFNKLRDYFKRNGYFDMPLSTYGLYEVMDAYYRSRFSDGEVFNDLLKYDYYASNLHGNRDLFTYVEIPGMNKTRLNLLKDNDFVHQINPELIGQTPKEMLKRLEFITFQYDLDTLIKTDFKVVNKQISIMVFDSKMHDVGIPIDVGLF